MAETSAQSLGAEPSATVDSMFADDETSMNHNHAMDTSEEHVQSRELEDKDDDAAGSSMRSGLHHHELGAVVNGHHNNETVVANGANMDEEDEGGLFGSGSEDESAR